MIYVIERVDYDQKPSNRLNYTFFTDLEKAARKLFLIREIYPHAEAWLWETQEFDGELNLGSLVAHLSPAEWPENKGKEE